MKPKPTNENRTYKRKNPALKQLEPFEKTLKALKPVDPKAKPAALFAWRKRLDRALRRRIPDLSARDLRFENLT